MENSRGRHETLTSGLHVCEGWQRFILQLSLSSYGSQNSGTRLWAEGMCAKGSCEDLSHWVISLAHTWLLHVGTGDRTPSSCLYSWSISPAPISLKFSRRWKQSLKPNTWLLLKTSPVTSPVCCVVSSPLVQPCLNVTVCPGQSPLPSCSFHSTELPRQPALQSCAAERLRLPWLYQAGSPADFFRTKPQPIFPWLRMHALPERVPAVLSNIPLWRAHPCIFHKLCCLALLGSNLMFSSGKRFGFKNKRDP